MRRSLLYLLLAFALAAFGQNLGYKPDADWQPPAEAAARPNPLADRTDLAAGGRKLFQRHCAECHSDDGRGLKKAADLQLPIVQKQTDGALHWKISNGNPRHGMPSFSVLPDLQRWQIVLHLRSLAVPPPEEKK
jgi:mono/diheme cytochrome c family protein